MQSDLDRMYTNVVRTGKVMHVRQLIRLFVLCFDPIRCRTYEHRQVWSHRSLRTRANKIEGVFNESGISLTKVLPFTILDHMTGYDAIRYGIWFLTTVRILSTLQDKISASVGSTKGNCTSCCCCVAVSAIGLRFILLLLCFNGQPWDVRLRSDHEYENATAPRNRIIFEESRDELEFVELFLHSDTSRRLYIGKTQQQDLCTYLNFFYITNLCLCQMVFVASLFGRKNRVADRTYDGLVSHRRFVLFTDRESASSHTGHLAGQFHKIWTNPVSWLVHSNWATPVLYSTRHNSLE